ncbi:response regulator transcription factor [Ferrovibrio sp.]|uniref:response regulator transcription factor n=1 Tax=Ferrovibrio sp. TaxID=1917215 RepID=UPI0026261C89|nr:response regulator transcription factor [Ferrovibrio sp.]
MSGQKHVLLVDDDRTLQSLLAEQLETTREFSAVCVNDATAALALVPGEHFDLLLLDVGLPDMDGRDLCRKLREKGVRAPIIMLTAADGEADTILGLESGANDYVTKPFKLGVLLARIRAQLRQFEQSEDAVFGIGPYTFRPASKLLLDNEKAGKKVRLTEKETAILKYLLRAGMKPVPRETLLAEVWGYNAGVSTHTLETHIYRLRQKIERDPGAAQLLITDPGGYRLQP